MCRWTFEAKGATLEHCAKHMYSGHRQTRACIGTAPIVRLDQICAGDPGKHTFGVDAAVPHGLTTCSQDTTVNDLITRYRQKAATWEEQTIFFRHGRVSLVGPETLVELQYHVLVGVIVFEACVELVAGELDILLGDPGTVDTSMDAIDDSDDSRRGRRARH